MHEYDVALKRILTRPGRMLLTALTGSPSLRWLNVEVPKVNNLRVDLLGESPDGQLIHIELQSQNEKDFPMQMGEYSFGVGLRYGHVPRQVALYVGAEPLRMKNEIAGPGGAFHLHLVDTRDLDGEFLLASDNPGDNVDLRRRWMDRLSGDRQRHRRGRNERVCDTRSSQPAICPS
jgi:hypothetical protein